MRQAPARGVGAEQRERQREGVGVDQPGGVFALRIIGGEHDRTIGPQRPGEGQVGLVGLGIAARITEDNVEDDQPCAFGLEAVEQIGVERAVPGRVEGLLQRLVRGLVEIDQDDLGILERLAFQKRQVEAPVIAGAHEGLVQPRGGEEEDAVAEDEDHGRADQGGEPLAQEFGLHG